MSLWPYPPKRVFTETLDEAHAREKAAEERRQRRVAEFEELKAWAETVPEIVLDLAPGELNFPAIYRPYQNAFMGRAPDTYGLVAPFERLCAWAQEAMPHENDLETFAQECAVHLRVQSPRPDGRGLDHDAVALRSKARPEVYTLGDKGQDHWEDLDRLVKELERLDARNLPRDRVFLGRRCRVHAKLYAYWTGDARVQYDKRGLSLGITKVGVRI